MLRLSCAADLVGFAGCSVNERESVVERALRGSARRVKGRYVVRHQLALLPLQARLHRCVIFLKQAVALRLFRRGALSRTSGRAGGINGGAYEALFLFAAVLYSFLEVGEELGFRMRLSSTQTLGMPRCRPSVTKPAFLVRCKLELAFFRAVLPREAGVDALERSIRWSLLPVARQITQPINYFCVSLYFFFERKILIEKIK
jgi:hypothetical protein